MKPRHLLAILLLSAAARAEKVCSLEGRTVHSLTGEPVRKARLFLGRALRPGSETSADSEPPRSLAVASDAEGKFTFTDIPAGRYVLVATRVGFLAERDSRLDGGPVTYLTCTAGEKLPDIVVKLTPQGVLLGRVLDEDGDPTPGAEITVRRLVKGLPQLVSTGSARSNDIGEYRIPNLRPGRYYMSVTGPDIPGPSQQAYATVYWPGSIDPAGALPIELGPGTERCGMDVRLIRRRVVSIVGKVEGVEERRALVYLFPKEVVSPAFPERERRASVHSGGRFELYGVPPGSYTLVAQVIDDERPGWARQALDVGESNLDKVTLTLWPPLSVSGQFRLEGWAAHDLGEVRIELRPAPGEPHGFGGYAVIRHDGAFQVSGLMADRFQVGVSGLRGRARIEAHAGN